MGPVFKKYRGLRALLERRYTRVSGFFEGKPSADDSNNAEVLRQRKRVSRVLFNLLFALIVALILIDDGPRAPSVVLLRPGEIAEQDVLSPITAEIEPKEAPPEHREELAKRVAPVFDYDDTLLDTWLQKWQEAFKTIRHDYYPSQKQAKTGAPMLDLVGQRIFDVTGQTLPARDLLFLHQNHFSQSLEQLFTKIGSHLLGRLIATSDLFPSYYSTGIIVRQLNQSLTETLVHDVSRIWSLDQAREFLNHVPTILNEGKDESAPRMVEMINHVVVPNLLFNQALTQKRIATILGLARQSVRSIKRGEVLIRKGERVTDTQAELLQATQLLMSPASRLKRFVLIFLILTVFFSTLFRTNVTRRGVRHLPLKDAIFFVGVTAFTLISVKYSIPYLRIFFAPFNLSFGVEYLMPIAVGGIVIHLMMGREAGLSFALLTSLVLGYMLDESFYFTLWSFTVIATAIHTIKGCKQRTDLYKAGALSGLLGALLVLGFSLTQNMGFKSVNWLSMGISVGLAFLSGLLATVLTGSLIPVLEAIFGYTTSLKLLELSNFNHPLLHDLMMKAPGTYHHSVIVGSLAEIAADRIKANGLLARVSAYYHDIGKMNKPLYFIENQAPNDNPHDHLSPSMSAKILFSHVKNGVRLAREYNLGGKITGIIEQHHGTTPASYFLNKAKRLERAELDTVKEADFCYPGPKPQSREAAIVMLADACEAATRSIAEPTPAKIQTMVHNIINRRFLEEQFHECDLTFRDLHIVEEAFTRTLVSLYHHRIEYPGQKRSAQHRFNPAAIPQIRKLQGGSLE